MIDKKRLIWIYKTMLRIRKFEERVVRLFESDKIRGSVHLYIGEEAIAATVCSLLRDTDYITSTHRGHGHCIAKGGDLKKAMAELMGKATGFCKGRGGSMHIVDMSKGNLGANAIVGGGIPIAVGGALAASIKKTDQVTVAFFGDGASNQGTFHEGINLAAVWKLPIIFICENNEFGLSAPVKQSTSVKDISTRSKSYDIPGCTVNGNDVFEINEVMEEAIARVKKGEGPTLIECKTYRWFGHWIGDPQLYRTKDEVEAWKEKCPIKTLEKYFLDKKELSKNELDEIEKAIDKEADDAVEFAINSPEPDPSTVMENVFTDIVNVYN